VVSEEESLSALDDIPDGDVEENNPGVGLWDLGSEFTVDIVPVGG